MSAAPFVGLTLIAVGIVLAVAGFLEHDPPLSLWKQAAVVALGAFLLAMGFWVLGIYARG